MLLMDKYDGINVMNGINIIMDKHYKCVSITTNLYILQ